MNFPPLFGFIRSKWIQITLGIVCTLLVLIVILFNVPVARTLISDTSYLIYDGILTFYPPSYKEVTKVFIVDIDDASIAKEGRWPWPRNKLAHLFSILQNAGVVVVGVDIIMSSPEINFATGLRDRLMTMSSISSIDPAKQINQPLLMSMLKTIAPRVNNDQELANAMKNYDVSLGFLFHDLSSVAFGMLPPPLTNSKGQLLNLKEFNAQIFYGYNASLDLFIKASGHGGFVSNIPDPDGVIREGFVLGGINNKVYPSLALMTAMRFLLADHIDLKKHKTVVGEQLYGIDVSGTFVPTNEHGQILIPFWGPQLTLPYVSATDILHGTFDANKFAGSVAIVGSSAVMLGDLHESPVAALFPGVEMVGNMVAGIIGQQLLVHFDWRTFEGVSIIIGLGFLFAFIAPYLSVIWLVISTLLLSSIITVTCIFLLIFKSFFMPAGCLLILIITQAVFNYSYQFILEKRLKSKIKQLFGQYVPESYVKELINSPDTYTMEGQTRELSVLFSDIRSFTDISEGLDAAGVKRLLNVFFTPITEIIFNHKGTIDKYVGDMVVAFWGAPIPIENNGHARQAILTALSMFKNLPLINEKIARESLPAVNIGIGLVTGLMNVGDMGSKFRRAYTVLGDNVNLASRLESLTKYYGIKILVNDYTREKQDEFLWRIIDKVTVKGRKTSLTIYEPLGIINEVSPELINEVEQYHQALDVYYMQNWDEAITLFIILQKQYPDTYLYQLYQARIERYKKNPPPPDWKGVFVHIEK